MTESNELRFIQSVRVSRYLYHEQTIEEGSRGFLTTFGCDVDHRIICKRLIKINYCPPEIMSLLDLNVVPDDKSVTHIACHTPDDFKPPRVRSLYTNFLNPVSINDALLVGFKIIPE